MNVHQIRARHASILSTVEGLECLVSRGRPDEVDGLAARRWAFTREMLQHCSAMRALLTTMIQDVRPEAARQALAAHREVGRFMAFFRAHAARWQGFPSAEQWADYQRALRRLIGAVRALIGNEERFILPLLPARPLGRQPDAGEDPYGADISAVQRMIYQEDWTPRA